MDEKMTALDVRLFMQRAGAELRWMHYGDSKHALGNVRVAVTGRAVRVYALKNKRFSPVLVSKLPVNRDEFTFAITKAALLCNG